MKAAYFSEHGSVEKLQVGELDLPELSSGMVKIQVAFSALNRLDLFVRKGAPNLKIPLPHVGGSDITGTIIEIGADVDQELIGRKCVVNPVLHCTICSFCLQGEHSLCTSFSMVGEHTWGGFAEFVIVPERNVYLLPDNADLRLITGLTLTSVTAWRMLTSKADVRPGKLVLIPGAAGGLSSAAIQLAKVLGAQVIAVTSTQRKEEYVKKLGADYVVNYKNNPEWSKEVWKISNKLGVDVVIESVGASTWEQSLRSLKKGGKLVTAGATTGFSGKTNIGLIFWKQLEILGSTMSNRQEFHEVQQLILQGKLASTIDCEFHLNDIQQAHTYLESGDHLGKVLIRVSDKV